MSQIDFCASGKWSVRKPPPFCLEKKPLKPQRLCFKAPTSSRSTTSRSPGSAPFTPIGPDRKCTIDPGHDRHVGMPAVVDHVVFVCGLGQIDLDQCLWHQELPLLKSQT